LLAFRRQLGSIGQALQRPGVLLRLAGSAILVSINWLAFVWAINNGQTVEVSLGYYINPLLNVVLGSANRDPSKFEDPDRFDIFRDRTVRHLGFASGPHVCIGQHLARVEMTRAVNAILDRLPNLRLDESKPAPQLRGHKLRVPAHIWVKFDA